MTDAATTSVSTRYRATLAAAIGNFAEWYDFAVYGFLAPVIALQFFASADSGAAILAAFAVFGVAFITRPLGGLFFGHLGDRIGRRTTLSSVILLMSLGTFAIGVLPTEAVVGALAPVLLVLARVVQGFSAGGELGGAITYVAEYAPPRRRGLYGSWVLFTQGLGALTAALVVAVLTSSLGETTMQAWGWRIPFLIALPVGLVGLYVRWAARETPPFAALKATRSVERAPLRATLRYHRRELVQVMGLVVTATAATQILTAFAPAFLQEPVGLSPAEALRASMAGLLTFIALCPLFGIVADRIGRKRVILATPIAAIVLGFPAFVLLAAGQPVGALLGCALIGLILAPFGGAGVVVMAELFPTRVRYSGLSIGSAIAISIFGGFTPLLLTWLVGATGSALLPGVFLAALGIVSLVAALTLTVTAETRLDAEVAPQPPEPSR